MANADKIALRFRPAADILTAQQDEAMKATLRHVGVFFIGFAAAFVIADNLSEDQDATRVYLYFLILFVAYLGVNYILGARRRP